MRRANDCFPGPPCFPVLVRVRGSWVRVLKDECACILGQSCAKQSPAGLPIPRDPFSSDPIPVYLIIGFRFLKVRLHLSTHGFVFLRREFALVFLARQIFRPFRESGFPLDSVSADSHRLTRTGDTIPVEKADRFPPLVTNQNPVPLLDAAGDHGLDRGVHLAVRRTEIVDVRRNPNIRRPRRTSENHFTW